MSNSGRLGLGPSASEFREVFGVGADDGRIHPVDGVGVALAAIQGLRDTLREQAEELTRLRGLIEVAEAATGPR